MLEKSRKKCMIICCIYNRNKSIKKFITSKYSEDVLYKDGLFINDKFIAVFLYRDLKSLLYYN